MERRSFLKALPLVSVLGLISKGNAETPKDETPGKIEFPGFDLPDSVHRVWYRADQIQYEQRPGVLHEAFIVDADTYRANPAGVHRELNYLFDQLHGKDTPGVMAIHLRQK